MCVIRRHFLACEDIAGGSDLSAGGTFFHEIRWPVWWVPAVRGKHFLVKYGGSSGGSLLSGGGIIILRVIRRHLLAAVWTQLSASPCTVLFRWKSAVDHVDHIAPRAPGRWSGRRRGLGRGRRRAREDTAVEARAERSTRVHWFGCGVRLPSPQSLASGGSSRGM